MLSGLRLGKAVLTYVGSFPRDPSNLLPTLPAKLTRSEGLMLYLPALSCFNALRSLDSFFLVMIPPVVLRVNNHKRALCFVWHVIKVSRRGRESNPQIPVTRLAIYKIAGLTDAQPLHTFIKSRSLGLQQRTSGKPEAGYRDGVSERPGVRRCRLVRATRFATQIFIYGFDSARSIRLG